MVVGMAVVNEIQLCSSFFGRKTLLLSSSKLQSCVDHEQHQNKSRFLHVTVKGKGRKDNNSHHVNFSRVNLVCATTSERLLTGSPEKPVMFKVSVLVTVRRSNRLGVIEKIVEGIDAVADKVGRNVVLELISTNLDSMTKEPKRSGKASLKGWLEKINVKEEQVVYSSEFTVDSSFGQPGAILVSNRHQREIFVETIVVEGFLPGPVRFNCHSWVQSVHTHLEDRVFFSNMPYLPSETPEGLKDLREKELKAMRGDGTGERKTSDRIYDYDKYNDLGNPDKGSEWTRPMLGGKEFPYPRRCRTGRAPTITDRAAETRVEPPKLVYVPRDERFEDGKNEMIDAGEVKAKFHVFVPALVATSDECHDFEGFHEVDSLYKVGVKLKQGLLQSRLWEKIPFAKKIVHETEELFRYDTPSIITKDNFAWLRDDEFARQAIAGINPVSIERLREFPPRSKLDPEIYGPPESAIKEEHILGHLNGMSVNQALEEKKLYMLDYHDIFLPFVDRINSQPGRKAYATRTLYFLTELGTLKPIAIELCLPPGTPLGRSTRVLTPPVDATTTWLWQLAKAHVWSNDAGVHQLVNHFLKTHACMEPFILSAHRQLSSMHPVYNLLDPHMRYTLEINGLARQILISAGGVIESFFTPGSVAMEISSGFYKDGYRFDKEGLPDDLLRRGMAEVDSSEKNGIRLLLPDYPYASDGLLIWSAVEKWVSVYVTFYYPNADDVLSDTELQSWYSEAINVGHEDMRECSWWPSLATPDDLISILTKIIWLCSAQHAALNFGQYPLGGYIPNRPTLMRRLIPEESDPEYKSFLSDPQKFFLSALPSLLQATKLMTVIDTLSTHSIDEEYIGEKGRQDYAWTPEISEAYNEFVAEIRRVEEEIERRNGDPNLRNRCGAGVLPYQLLMPSSGPGITFRGVPNSITI